MTTPNTQPTTDEVAIADLPDLDERAKTLYDKTNALFGITDEAYLWERIDEIARETWRNDVRISPSYLKSQLANLATHTAKLRAENEGLKSQNAVMVEGLKLAQRKFRILYAFKTEELETFATPYDAALAGSTTPNAFDRVRELEEALRVRIQHGECPECRCNFFAGS